MEKETNLSAEQSLSIITSMLRQTRGNLKNKSFYFILWGWVTVAGNLGHYVLMQFTDYHHPYIVWVISIPAWIISMIHGKNESVKTGISTYSGTLIMWIWVAFSINLIIIIFSGYFYGYISPLILLQAGLCTFITGLVVKYKPLIIGGSLFWVFAVVALIVSPPNALLISAAAILIGYLVPGYMLRNHKE